jgi:hypothetical protein
LTEIYLCNVCSCQQKYCDATDAGRVWVDTSTGEMLLSGNQMRMERNSSGAPSGVRKPHCFVDGMDQVRFAAGFRVWLRVQPVEHAILPPIEHGSWWLTSLPLAALRCRWVQAPELPRQPAGLGTVRRVLSSETHVRASARVLIIIRAG